MREHCYIQQFSIVLQKNKIDFLRKSVKNLLSWIIGRMQGIFFNLVLLLVKTNNILKVWVSNLIFLECFRGTCFCNSPGFHISSLAMCIVWLLICYFYFSNKADKFCFSFFFGLSSLCYLYILFFIYTHFVIFNSSALFCKKIRLAFFLKSVTSLLTWIIGRMQGIFLNLALLLVKTNNILKVWV